MQYMLESFNRAEGEESKTNKEDGRASATGARTSEHQAGHGQKSTNNYAVSTSAQPNSSILKAPVTTRDARGRPQQTEPGEYGREKLCRTDFASSPAAAAGRRFAAGEQTNGGASTRRATATLDPGVGSRLATDRNEERRQEVGVAEQSNQLMSTSPQKSRILDARIPPTPAAARIPVEVSPSVDRSVLRPLVNNEFEK
jgi:hypothetical protein